MNIKNLTPHARTYGAPFKQGYYEPVNKDKYNGAYPIIYRSSWEYKVCRILDLSDNVVSWGSECLKIPYFSCIDQKYHEYFPDFYFIWKSGDVVKKIVIEVKPKKYLTQPEKPKRITEKSLANYKRDSETYIKNMEKAKACKKYCDEHEMEYKFVTEDSKLPNL